MVWQEDAYHERVIIVIKDFLKFKTACEWDIKRVVNDTTPKYHSGFLRSNDPKKKPQIEDKKAKIDIPPSTGDPFPSAAAPLPILPLRHC